MAEPFSIATGAIQVASAGIALAKTLYEYLESAKSANKHIKAIAVEVRLTSSVLEQLGRLLEETETEKLCSNNIVTDAKAAFSGCEDAFRDVNEAVKVLVKPPTNRTRNVSLSASLIWPFKKVKLEALQANLERLKTTLLLMLSVLGYARDKAAKSAASETKSVIERLQIQNLIKAKNDATERYERLVLDFSHLQTPSQESSALDHSMGFRSIPYKSNTFLHQPVPAAVPSAASAEVKHVEADPTSGPDYNVLLLQLDMCSSALWRLTSTINTASWNLRAARTFHPKGVKESYHNLQTSIEGLLAMDRYPVQTANAEQAGNLPVSEPEKSVEYAGARPKKISLNQQAQPPKHDFKRSKDLASERVQSAATLYRRQWEHLMDGSASATEDEGSRDSILIPASPYQSLQRPLESRVQPFSASPRNAALTPPPPDTGVGLQNFPSMGSNLSSYISHRHRQTVGFTGSQGVQPRQLEDHLSTTPGSSSMRSPSDDGREAGESTHQRGRLGDATLPESMVTFKYTRTGRLSKASKGQRVHPCDECGKTYTRAEHLRHHQKNHKPGGFPCDVPGCGRSFHREDLLIRHKARHDDPLNPPSRPASPSCQDSASLDRDRVFPLSLTSSVGPTPLSGQSHTIPVNIEQPSSQCRNLDVDSRSTDQNNAPPRTAVPTDASTRWNGISFHDWQWNPASPYSPSGFDWPHDGTYYSLGGPPYFQPQLIKSRQSSDSSHSPFYPPPSRSPASAFQRFAPNDQEQHVRSLSETTAPSPQYAVQTSDPSQNQTRGPTLFKSDPSFGVISGRVIPFVAARPEQQEPTREAIDPRVRAEGIDECADEAVEEGVEKRGEEGMDVAEEVLNGDESEEQELNKAGNVEEWMETGAELPGLVSDGRVLIGQELVEAGGVEEEVLEGIEFGEDGVHDKYNVAGNYIDLPTWNPQLSPGYLRAVDRTMMDAYSPATRQPPMTSPEQPDQQFTTPKRSSESPVSQALLAHQHSRKRSYGAMTEGVQYYDRSRNGSRAGSETYHSNQHSGHSSPNGQRSNTTQYRPDPPKNNDGKYICTVSTDCAGQTFDRKCEWNKHMDKHNRPYRCAHPDCAKLQGFTYSGGLSRHEREMHGKHGGPKSSIMCPYSNCKRKDKGFTRQENLKEHIRRIHSTESQVNTSDFGEYELYQPQDFHSPTPVAATSSNPWTGYGGYMSPSDATARQPQTAPTQEGVDDPFAQYKDSNSQDHDEPDQKQSTLSPVVHTTSDSTRHSSKPKRPHFDRIMPPSDAEHQSLSPYETSEDIPVVGSRSKRYFAGDVEDHSTRKRIRTEEPWTVDTVEDLVRRWTTVEV